MYERTLRTSVCRGTVSGSAPPHSTTVRSPNGKRTVRVVAPKREATSRPFSQATCVLAHHVTDRPPRPAARADALDRVRDDDLVERAVDLLGGEARSEVARDVVEAERGQHRDAVLAVDELVEQRDELLLAGRVEIVRARVDRRPTGASPSSRKGPASDATTAAPSKASRSASRSRASATRTSSPAAASCSSASRRRPTSRTASPARRASSSTSRPVKPVAPRIASAMARV